MPNRRLLALLGLVATVPGASAAQADDDHERARAARRDGRVLPLETIVAKAKADVPGDVLDVELEDEHGRIVYEIKTITADGRILKLEYDAATGALLKTKGRGAHPERR